jgi:hypothetical protein
MLSNGLQAPSDWGDHLCHTGKVNKLMSRHLICICVRNDIRQLLPSMQFNQNAKLAKKVTGLMYRSSHVFVAQLIIDAYDCAHPAEEAK